MSLIDVAREIGGRLMRAVCIDFETANGFMGVHAQLELQLLKRGR